ncbi:MAG: hypothetical protein WA749_13265 [Gelidibacter sp.]
MKNKTKTYILLVTVLGVWGIIAYKMISAIRPAPPEIASHEQLTDFKPKQEVKRDTFSITPVSRDPFLGNLTAKSVIPPSRHPIKNSPEIVPVENPLITYGGLIKKQNNDAQIFVLNINSTQYLLKKGQRVNDVTLVRGNSKEVVIRYKNAQQTIALQK